MMSRVDTAKEGGAVYLQRGLRADSKYTREEKDDVIVLYGSLELIKKAEQYCMENKPD